MLDRRDLLRHGGRAGLARRLGGAGQLVADRRHVVALGVVLRRVARGGLLDGGLRTVRGLRQDRRTRDPGARLLRVTGLLGVRGLGRLGGVGRLLGLRGGLGVRRLRLLHDGRPLGGDRVGTVVAGLVREGQGVELGVVEHLGPHRARPVPALRQVEDGLGERHRDGLTVALGLPLVLHVDDRRRRHVEEDLERHGVAGDVLQHDGVPALDRAELARHEAVQVRPLVVGQVLLDTVDEHLVDTAQPVEELEAGVAEDPVPPDGLELDGDRRRDVVDVHAERLAGVVAGLVGRADLDLGLDAAGELGGVERGGEVVGVLDLEPLELLPLAAHQLLDLHVGLGRVGLVLRDGPGVRPAHPLAAGRRVDDRLGGVEGEGVRRLVAQRVHQDEGVETLLGAEDARHDVVEVGPDVVRQVLLDTVDDRLVDLGGVEQLDAELLVDAVRTRGTLRLDREGRAGGVQGEDDDRHVARDVVHLEGVGALHGAVDAGLDPVEVAVDVVGEVLDHAVDLDVVDLAGVVQLEADAPVDTVLADGLGLDGDRRGDRVDRRDGRHRGDLLHLRRGHLGGGLGDGLRGRLGGGLDDRLVDDGLAARGDDRGRRDLHHGGGGRLGLGRDDGSGLRRGGDDLGGRRGLRDGGDVDRLGRGLRGDLVRVGDRRDADETERDAGGGQDLDGLVDAHD